MAYCTHCGTPMDEKIPVDDDRLRLVCPSCGDIAYVNPKMVVGTLPIVEGRVLLLRRGIEPRLGYWTYPGGFLEMGETAEEGACREAMEELGITVGGLRLHGVYSRPATGVVTVVYLADLVEGSPRRTHEAIEAAFFGPAEIPWSDLAFPTTVHALHDWIASRS